MNNLNLRFALPSLLFALGVCASFVQDEAKYEPKDEITGIKIQYLEIVTPEVEATCESYGLQHGVKFTDPVPELGNARTAALAGGGMIGVRAPMHEAEEPVTRPYLLVDDIEAAIEAAKAAGAEFMMTSTEIPGSGKFAIYNLGDVQHALWQL